MERCRLTCIRCSRLFSLNGLKGKCDCGGTLLVEYDLEQVRNELKKEMLPTRSRSMWRYRELLPVHDFSSIVSMGEGVTPLVRMPRWERKFPVKEIWVKREEQNPTGSFKARGFSVSVSLLQEREIKKVAVNSNGNAASALAAYAAYAGMEAFVFLPQDCPRNIVQECIHYGAATCLVDGLIHDAARIIDEGKSEQGWFHVGTLKEPGRVEGKKTMGLELAEQMNWSLPEVIIYPTGGGSGIIGIWKALRELQQLGWIEGDLPRFISVQEEGCQPVVDAIYNDGRFKDILNEETRSQPTGMRVPLPPDGTLLTNILYETGGTAVAVTAEEIRMAQEQMAHHGISSSPEGAATLAALYRLCDSNQVGHRDRVVLFNTSHAMKYWESSLSSFVPIVSGYAQWRSHIYN